MVVSITGSREYQDPERVRVYVRSLPKGTIVISGGATGKNRARSVDWVAEDEARKCGLVCEIYHAKWRVNGVFNPHAGLERNFVLAKRGMFFAVFWDGNSPGTSNMITQVLQCGKPLIINPKRHPDAASSLVPSLRTAGTEKCP